MPCAIVMDLFSTAIASANLRRHTLILLSYSCNKSMKAETTGSFKIQCKVEGDGRMVGFQDASQVFPCVEWMGWNTTNPDRGNLGQHLGRCCKTPGDSQAASSWHHTNALTPGGTEQEGHEHDLVLTSAPASKAELT